MSCLEATGLLDGADDVSPGVLPPDSGAPLQRLRADLGALCLLAHEDAIDRLIDAYRLQRPTRVAVRETYRSLRRLRRAETDVTARFVEDALNVGEPDALLRSYADALAELALHGDIRDALLRAMQGRLQEELSACLHSWCELVRARVREADARRESVLDASDLLPHVSEPGDRHLAAWRAVAEAIEPECVRGMPPLVRALLRGPWSQAMAAAALRCGVASPEFRHVAGIAAALGDAFAGWAGLAAPQARWSQRAMHALAPIAVELRAGLERVGYSPRQVVELWRQLTRLIVQPLREDAPRAVAALPLHGPDLDAALRALLPAEPAGTMQRPAALRVGQAVDWNVPGRDPQRLKLCWRSIASGWHVFVNAAGMKTLELPAARIARMLADGELVPKDMSRCAT